MGAIRAGKGTVNKKALTFGLHINGSTANTTGVTATADNLITRARVLYSSNVALTGLINSDGVTVAAGDTGLCVGQTDPKQNGLWIISPSGWTRSSVALRAGQLVRITEGTNNANTIWGCGNATDPVVNTDNITYARKDATAGALLAANNLSDVANVATSRTNLGLGTIATQAANNVNITGGQITGLSRITVTGSNSTISIGVNTSATITAVGVGSVVLQSASANLRVLQDRVDGTLGHSSSSILFYLIATAVTSNGAFLGLRRVRNSGSNNLASDFESATNGTLSFNDIVTMQKRITPNTGVGVANAFQTIVTDTDSSTPDSAEDIITTHNGVSARSMRIGSGYFRTYKPGGLAYVGINVPAALSSSYDLTMPAASPAGGQFLTSDGTGQLYWTDNVFMQTIFNSTNGLQMAANKHYVVIGNSGTEVAMILPTNTNTRMGDYIKVTRRQGDTNTWRISQNSGQRIRWSGAESTLGTSGYAQSNGPDTSALIMCVDTDSSTYATWQIVQQEGLPLLV